MSEYTQYLERQVKRHGDKFDPSNLAPQFAPYLHSWNRVAVDMGDKVRKGYVGVTTGPKPVFLLMYRLTSIGSSNLLNSEHKLLKVFPRKT